MARLVFIISLAFAAVALYGWPADASVWLRALIALAAIATGIGALALASPISKSSAFESVGRPRAADHALGAALFAAAIVAFYFILVFSPPAAGRFSEYVVMVVRSGLDGSGWSQEAGTDDPALEQASQNTDYDVGALFDPNGAVIPKSANLNPTKKPAISLKLKDRASAERLRKSGQIYLHLFSHYAFDGERWTAPAQAVPQQLTPGADGLIRLQPGPGDAAYQYTVLHHELSTGLDALSTLQGARHVKLPRLTELHAGTWLLPPPDNPLGIIRPYEAGSTPKRLRDLLASGAAIVPGNPGPVYFAASKDERLNIEVRKRAALFRNQPTTGARLIELQRWLTGSFGYNMQLDYPDKEQSALQSFLENPGAGEGFCVHFASAAVLILRELGVPSRISYGWTGGEYYRSHHQFVFEAEDGHAWAEIYLKDQGWVVFETTPSSGVPATNAAAAEVPPPVAGDPRQEDARKPSSRDMGPSWTWMAAAMAAALVLLMALLLRRKQLERARFGAATDIVAAPPDYLQNFLEALARMGHPKPAGLTMRRHVERLAQEGLVIDFADELVTYHYRVIYREDERDAGQEKRLCRLIRAL